MAVGAMKRIIAALVAIASLVFPAAAVAHPLGNFTVNRFSRVEVSGPRIYVRYVLDLAEIPTFQAGRIDARAYAQRISRGAELTIAGRRVSLTPVATALAHPNGAGGLKTTRLETILRGPTLTRPTTVRYVDRNFADRIGWKEIVVGADAPSESHELRAYPKDLLQSPADVTSITTRLTPTGRGDVPPPLSRGASLRAPDRVADSGFARLIARDELGVWVILASLAVAMFWGAAHALSPGHGKTIITAYLVGQRGTPRHAVLLGLIVTATHTIGVFGLGLVTLLLSRFLVPDRLYPWLNLISGVVVVGIGASVLASRVRRRRQHHHHQDHAHGPITVRSLLAVGVSGGLLPCPSALVVLLGAISLHRVGYGLLLILAFSVGLAATVSGIGLLAVLAKRAFNRVSFDGRLASALPALSALVIFAAGVAMTAHAVPKVL